MTPCAIKGCKSEAGKKWAISVRGELEQERPGRAARSQPVESLLEVDVCEGHNQLAVEGNDLSKLSITKVRYIATHTTGLAT